MSNGLITTPSRRSVKPIITPTGVKYGSEIRTFLWDNPELRKAFKTAKDREQRSDNLRKEALKARA